MDAMAGAPADVLDKVALEMEDMYYGKTGREEFWISDIGSHQCLQWTLTSRFLCERIINMYFFNPLLFN